MKLQLIIISFNLYYNIKSLSDYQPVIFSENYKITLLTSKTTYAGTDDPLFIKLYGTDASTAEFILDNENVDDFRLLWSNRIYS